MSIDYIRPKQIDEALRLLEQKSPKAVPMGGGTSFGQYSGTPITVVDLQELRLDEINDSHDEITIGSMATIAALENCPAAAGYIRSAAE
ncbi:MAG: FAD-binding protein, partial [Anaerolineaceae bacterium]|nr:FAD-binding protein [Anaerolineaceae bacterium]